MAKLRRGRTTGKRRTKKLFVIATEGRNTERIYFEAFNPGRTGSFRIALVANPTNRSSPVDVVKRLLKAEKERKGVETRVEYWAVIDRDSRPEDQLEKAWSRIESKQNFHLAVSDPCFELWLYLHLQENRPFANQGDCLKALEEVHPHYDKSRYEMNAFKPNVDIAISRAKALDTQPCHRWPDQQGTRVYRLVENFR